MLFLTFMNYHWLRKLALPLMGLTLLLLIWVLVVQEERYGAARSIYSGSIQPSELAKLALIIYLSIWLYNRRDQIHGDSLVDIAPGFDPGGGGWAHLTAA